MTVFDNNENLGTQWLALDMLALDIGWLQEEMEAARRLALEALRLEREAAARAKQNPPAVKEWQEARENFRQADAEFQSALATFLKASRKLDSDDDRRKP